MRVILGVAGAALALWIDSAAQGAGGPPQGRKQAEAPVQGDQKPTTTVPVDFAKQVVPVMQKYCASCHGAAKKNGDLDLQAWTGKGEPEALRAIALWLGVAERLAAREMPPEERPQPSEGERELVLRWTRQAEARAALERPDPGRVTIRRLNRAEYNNTVRDLLGVGFDAARDFPADDVGYGFDNIGDVLSMPPLLVERYLLAAERIARRIILSEVPPRSQRRAYEIERLVPTPPGSRIAGSVLLLSTDGRVRASHDFPVTGEYRLVVRAHGRQRSGQPPRLAVRLDGVDLRTFSVTATKGAPGLYAVGATVEAGPHHVELALINGGTNEGKRAESSQRTLALDSLTVEGPRSSTWRLPETHTRLIPRRPTKGQWKEDAREFLAPLARRAFRRPVTEAEVARLTAFVEEAVGDGRTFEEGMQMALRALLVSPHFLFRVELDEEPAAPGTEVRPLGDWALASRLSYFLWSSMPDEELFRLAAEERLRESGVLETQVKRMLQDPRSKALAENFATQWLEIRTLPGVRRASRQFPSFDGELRSAMVQETELFFEEVVRRDLSVSTFLDADFTFLNERLARHYGIPGVEGKAFRRVNVTDGVRGGVLTQASVLTVTSNPTRTSAVKRGRWVLEQLLGTPPAPPPPGVPDLKEKDARRRGLTTLRQVLEEHRQNPACAVCHKKLDPLGFGLENFDAVGVWRTHEGDTPIDASGVLPDGQRFDGVRELKAVLLTKEQLFRRSFASKLLTYALGRGVEAFDRLAVERICQEMARDGNTFSSLVLAIAKSDPFQRRRVLAATVSSEEAAP